MNKNNGSRSKERNPLFQIKAQQALCGARGESLLSSLCGARGEKERHFTKAWHIINDKGKVQSILMQRLKRVIEGLLISPKRPVSQRRKKKRQRPVSTAR